MIRSPILLFAVVQLVAFGHGFEIQPRIIDGLFSDVSQFPFYVYLENGMACGGTLLSNK